MYVYIETSLPRQLGDTARLESPWMRGPQCMTFYYHMYGSTMSCLAIYIRHQATNRLKPVWVKSQDQGDRWIQGQISINETASYQVSLYNISLGRLIKKLGRKPTTCHALSLGPTNSHYISLLLSVTKYSSVGSPCEDMYTKCILNWPLPIGAFQDQYKQTMVNKYSIKHNYVKNPNW